MKYNKLIYLLLALILKSGLALAQHGTVKGIIIESDT
jgi:hypothetical protein